MNNVLITHKLEDRSAYILLEEYLKYYGYLSANSNKIDKVIKNI